MANLIPARTKRSIEDLDDPELIGLQEFTVDSPWGPWRIQFWLARRRDGGSHVQFVRTTLYLGRPDEHLDFWKDGERIEAQVDWLSDHREELYQRMHEIIVSGWWDSHDRRPLPPRGTPRYCQLSLWPPPPARA